MSSYPTRRRQRLAGFDYSTAGCYFVTLCVQDRLPCFGHVHLGEMQRSAAGDLMARTLDEIAHRYPGIVVDTAMVMPDHVHLILALTGEAASLSAVIQWFKAQTTARYARGVRDEGWPRFSGRLWQRGFYDRVIRTDEELEQTRAYLLTNPERRRLRDEGHEGGSTPRQVHSPDGV